MVKDPWPVPTSLSGGASCSPQVVEATSEPRGSVSWVNRGKQRKQQMHWRDTFYPFHLTTKKRNVRTFPSDAHLKGGQQTVFSSLLYNCQLRQVSIHARTSEKHRHLLVIKYQRILQQCNTILVWLSGEVYLASLTGYPRDFGSRVPPPKFQNCCSVVP